MPSVQMLKLSSPVAQRGDGTRGPHHFIASSTTTTYPKRSDSVSTSKSVIQQWITFTDQVAYNLDEAPPRNSVAKNGGVTKEASCFPPQFSYGDPVHKCTCNDLHCPICGHGRSRTQPAQGPA